MSSKIGPKMTYMERAMAFLDAPFLKSRTRNALTEPIQDAIHRALGYEVRVEVSY
jgi:hypothetical protein